MSADSGVVGLIMFIAALAATVLTGLPVYAVQLGVAALFATFGVLTGLFDASILGALPTRLVGLLESDLLQALPLYALIGAVLNRLPLAARMHQGGQWLLRRQPGAAELSALLVSALLAPMNGSVGASLHMLSRSVAPRLREQGLPAERAAATLCVASTLGVVIPPSLVLLLLGDAMMRAHTEAVNATQAAVRIVNNADVLRAALVPGALVVLMSLALAAWRNRGASAAPARPLAWHQGLVTATMVLVIGTLLAAVAAGRLYAVEAAAAGGLLLLAAGAAAGELGWALLRQILRDAMILTGVLFALLIAATSFTLVLRAFGSDRMAAAALQSLGAHPSWTLAAIMTGMIACACVLDAFEMIFLVVPLVMPAVLQTQPDAAWVAVLTLLVLQTGYLLPPFGYAVLMSRTLMPDPPTPSAAARALAPQLIGQFVLIVLVMTCPQITRWMRPDDAPAAPVLSNEQVEQLLQQQQPPPPLNTDTPTRDSVRP